MFASNNVCFYLLEVNLVDWHFCCLFLQMIPIFLSIDLLLSLDSGENISNGVDNR